MSKSITVKFADGTSHTFNNVPDNVTQAEAEAKAREKYKKDIMPPPGVNPNGQAKVDANGNQSYADKFETMIVPAAAGANMLWHGANALLSSPVGHALELGAGGLGLYKAGRAIANSIRPNANPVAGTGPAPIGPEGAGLPPVPGGGGQQVQGEGGRAVGGGHMTHEQAMREPSYAEREYRAATEQPSIIETPIESGAGPRETTRYGSAASETGVSDAELLRAARQQPIPPVEAPVVEPVRPVAPSYTAPGAPTMPQGQPPIEYSLPQQTAPVVPETIAPIQGEARVGVPNMNPPIPQASYGELAKQYGLRALRALPIVGAGYEGYQGARAGLAGDRGAALEHAANAGMWLGGMPGATVAGATYAPSLNTGEQAQLNQLYPNRAAESERNRMAIAQAGRQPRDQADLDQMIREAAARAALTTGP
jgi:hypothetical protein